jgi:flagellar motor switch protein FliN/FliY
MDEKKVNAINEEDQQDEVARPVKFPELKEEASRIGLGNLEKLLNVPLKITVELGRTDMTLREVLNLSVGQVVPLDKIAGEPVDLLVNDRFFATGEVVKYKDNYGVRIVEIISEEERLNRLL